MAAKLMRTILTMWEGGSSSSSVYRRGRWKFRYSYVLELQEANETTPGRLKERQVEV